MNKEDIQKIIEAINKTGFITEFNASKILLNNGWFTINNRYYLDDHTGIPREIDIIAYKTSKVKNLLIYTALVISCKKSSDDCWIFFTKNLNKSDPNLIYENLDTWTNEKILIALESKSKIETNINNKIIENGFIKDLFGIEKNVFAMQEMNRKTFSLRNDQNIYNSIISVLKAKEFELGSLNSRKKNKTVYNFFNISLQDLEMLEFDPENETSQLKETFHIKYLNRFILNRKDRFHLIHFIKFNYFEEFLRKINLLHDFFFNEYTNQLEEMKNIFYSSFKIYNSYLEEIKKELSFTIYFELKYNAKLIEEDIVNISFGSRYQSEALIIYLGFEDQVAIDYCNNNNKIKEKTEQILEKYYYFTIIFKFSGEDSYPF